MKYYIGIDGGGTKTEFVLADENGNALTALLKEGSNPNDKGIENSYNILLKGIQELLKGKEISLQNIFIFAGISGAAVGNNAKILKTKLSKDYPNVEVESDLMNALEICLCGDDGIAVICGTGISSIISVGGKNKIVGGYGYLFEDGGSGYAYGRDAIKAAIRYEDGVGDETLLYEYLTESLGDGIRAGLGKILTKGKFFVASFCPLVFKGYDKGDEICRQIIRTNLQHTASLVEDALSVYLQEKPKIAFMGGVSKARACRDFIKEKFKHYEIYFNEEKPVMGAVRKAIKGEKKC